MVRAAAVLDLRPLISVRPPAWLEPEARALDALDHTAIDRRALEQSELLAAPARRAWIIAGWVQIVIVDGGGEKAEVGIKPLRAPLRGAEVAHVQRRGREGSEGLAGAGRLLQDPCNLPGAASVQLRACSGGVTPHRRCQVCTGRQGQQQLTSTDRAAGDHTPLLQCGSASSSASGALSRHGHWLGLRSEEVQRRADDGPCCTQPLDECSPDIRAVRVRSHSSEEAWLCRGSALALLLLSHGKKYMLAL